MTTPSVGIDGFNLMMPHGTGVATYGSGLAEAARSLGLGVEGLFGVPVGLDPRIRQIIFYDALGRGVKRLGKPWMYHYLDRWAAFRGVKIRDVEDTGVVERRHFAQRLPVFDRIRSGAWLFERADAHFRGTRRFLSVEMENPPSIMHWTYPLPIRLEGARNIYTLHDLVPLKLPYATLDRKRLYHNLIERCVEQADHIVTVSESSRRDIMDLFDIAPERITNTYQHVPAPPAEEPVGDLEGIFGVRPDGYFLYFGAIEPKKNIGRLLEAFLSIATSTPLVIVGARAWQSEDELRLIKRGGGEGKRGRIIQLDYLPRRLLMKLVAGARAVLFPSLYEGFGLPVLEAMQLGTPVITSTAGSLPEVAGDAALTVDPYDVGALSAAIRRIDGDAALRATLSARGLSQAARFSLDQHRSRLHAVYQAVLAAPPRA